MFHKGVQPTQDGREEFIAITDRTSRSGQPLASDGPDGVLMAQHEPGKHGPYFGHAPALEGPNDFVGSDGGTRGRVHIRENIIFFGFLQQN